MTVEASLLQGIRARLGIAPGLTTASAVSDLFEVYIFSIILRAARNEGASISYRNVHNQISQSWEFRTSPGRIHGTARSYTHGVIEFPPEPPSTHSLLEVHVGVRVQGRSNVLHECDVCVIEQKEAEICRTEQREPRSS